MGANGGLEMDAQARQANDITRGQQCAVVYSAISNEEEEKRFLGQGKASLSKRIMVVFYFPTCVK